MSWKATAYVKELRIAPNGEAITRSEKLLLFVLADYHNSEKKIAWPSVATLTEDAMMSLRQVQNLLLSLNRKSVLKTIEPQKKGRGYLKSYAFLGVDRDLSLQHTLNPHSCDACKDPAILNKGAIVAPFPSVEIPLERCKNDAGNVKEGCKNGAPYKEGTKNLKSNVKPSVSDEPDPRHAPIKHFIKESHSKANQMPPELVPWDGAEGSALKKLLTRFPTLTVYQAKECIVNYYRSDLGIDRYPRRWIPDLLEFWSGDKNQFGTPRWADKDYQREMRIRAEGRVGVR